VQTDPNAVAPAAPLDRPVAGGAVTDPVFGTTIRRASDSSETGEGRFEVQVYSQLQAFSADNAFILLTSDQGYIVRRVSDFGRVEGLQLGEINVPRWHPTQPHVLIHFDTNADDDLTLQLTDVDTGVTTDVATLPDLVRIDGNRSFDEVSRDGRWLAGLARRADESPVLFAWDLVDNTFGAYLPLAEQYATRCEPDSTWGEVWPDWIAPSPLGNYLVVQWQRGGPVPCGGLETFDIRAGTFVGRVYDGHQHGDLGISEDGREFFMVGETYHPSGNAAIGYRWLPGEETVSPPNYVQVLGDWVIGHFSCQGTPGVCLVTTGENPGNGRQPLEGELFLQYLDGSVRRLAHHRSSSCGYWAQPRATISQDGALVAFSSDWGVATCGPANEGLGTADPYVLLVPQPNGLTEQGSGINWNDSAVETAITNGTRPVRGLAGRGNRAELAHQPEQILHPPLFRDPAAGQAVNARSRHGHRRAGGRDALEVTAMRPGPVVAGHHLVPLRDQVLDRDPQVGEGAGEGA
jgi:hypothetical protein